MQVTILGACANQTANREGVSFLVESNTKDQILIDCGPGIVSTLGKCNRKASDINHLFLTHVHGDHISGFSYFVWNRHFERLGKEPASDLYVYGQKDTLEYAKFTIEHSYPELSFPFKVNYIEIAADSVFECGNLKVLPFEAKHTVPCLGCM